MHYVNWKTINLPFEREILFEYYVSELVLYYRLGGLNGRDLFFS